jgi:DNA-binding SARP family transcriptional activator
MMDLREERRRYLEAAHLQDLTLQQLKEEVMTTTRQTLNSWKTPKAPLEIRMLGCLQVTRNGRLVAEAGWGSEKAKRLLAYLLWKSPDGATREELSEALWPNRSLEDTANVFHVTLHRLRRVLQPQPGAKETSRYIVHDRGRYRFNLDAPHWLDVTEFQDRVKLHGNLQTLQAAVELYRGCYMEDMAWALPGEVEVERRRLEHLYADALRQLAARAKPRDAEIYLEKLLVVEPADETAYRALVLSYLGRGRLNLAKQQALRWQQSLADLDLEPSPEARTLWHKVTAFNGYSNSVVT